MNLVGTRIGPYYGRMTGKEEVQEDKRGHIHVIVTNIHPVFQLLWVPDFH